MTHNKTKKKLGPWEGICCESCWNATEKKCVCRKCDGRNHGKGVTKKYGKIDDFLKGDNEEQPQLEGQKL